MRDKWGDIPRDKLPHRVKNVKMSRQGGGPMRGENKHPTGESGCAKLVGCFVLVMICATVATIYGAYKGITTLV